MLSPAAGWARTRKSRVLPGFSFVGLIGYNDRCRTSKFRGVAQLVEHRSPKPGVAGSSPVSPAMYFRQVYKCYL
jgi:hypothetical protein